MAKGDGNSDPLKNDLVRRIYKATKSELKEADVREPVRLAFHFKLDGRYYTVKLTEVRIASV